MLLSDGGESGVPFVAGDTQPSLPLLSGRTGLEYPLPLTAPVQTQPSGGPGFVSAGCSSLKTEERQTPPNTGAHRPETSPPPCGSLPSFPLRGGAAGRRMKGRLPRLTQPPASRGQTVFFILSDFIMHKCQSLLRSGGLGEEGGG